MSQNDYLYHKPDEAGIKAIARIRRIFINAEKEIEGILGELGVDPAKSRDFSLTKTNLEYAMMRANKAVVMHYPAEELPDESSGEAAPGEQ